MKNLRLAAAAAIALSVTLLSSGSAQAYPDSPNVTITISGATIIGGDTFDYTASADVDCEWTVTYDEAVNGSDTQTGSGDSLSGTFDTKVVTEVFRSDIVAECTYDDNVPAAKAKVVFENDVTPAFHSADDSSVLQAAQQNASASAVVTLLPRGGDVDDDNANNGDNGDDNGVLPDTGGASFWILVLGGVLVVAGAGALYASRRRHTAH